MREASNKHVKETQIRGRLCIEGRGQYEISLRVSVFSITSSSFSASIGILIYSWRLKAISTWISTTP